MHVFGIFEREREREKGPLEQEPIRDYIIATRKHFAWKVDKENCGYKDNNFFF